MNVTVTKVVAFTLAAGIAGLGGAAVRRAGRDRSGPTDFAMLVSLILLLIIALGGIDTVAGAFAAAMLYALSPVHPAAHPHPDPQTC